MPYARLAGVVVMTATLATLSACSGDSQQPAAPGIPSLDRAARVQASKKPTQLIFAADEGTKSVYAYLNTGNNQSPTWSYSAGLKYPAALWVDGSLNLYVGDAAGYIYEFDAPNASGPPTAPNFTYDNLGSVVSHVATCGNYLYASNIIDSNQSASLTVWQIGNKTPIANFEQPNYNQIPGWGVTCDDETGLVYFAYDASYAGPGEIDQYGAGTGGYQKTLSIGPEYGEGLTFNSRYTTVVLGDGFNEKGGAIEFWTLAGKLVHEIIAPWVSSPQGFAYEHGDKALWDADAGNNALHRFAPAKGTLLNTITNIGNGKVFTSLQDVAVSPPDHK